MSSFMMGNNKNISQWYLHTFGTSQQEKANKISQYLRQNLKPGEKYVLLFQNGLHCFQVLTTFAQLGLEVQGVQNINIRKTGPNDKMFNQTRNLLGAKVFEKPLQNQININPMMMQKKNMMNMINNNAMNIQMMMNQNIMNQNMINNQNMFNNNAMMQNKNKQNNIINKNWGFNNQFGNLQFNNNSINQQEQALKALDPKNCETQHIKQFFNEETILKKIKDCQTKYPVNNNVIQTYLNWFSDYICRMYKLINVGALGKYKKEQPWQGMLSRKNEKIKFNINDNTVQSDLMDLIKQDFLNGRNHLLDGHDLINDINQTMNLLAQCSLKVYNREINEKGIYRIVAVYEQLCSCLAANPKAFLDRGILGFGSDRDNALRNVVNDNVKVANLKDLIAGAIKILPV